MQTGLDGLVDSAVQCLGLSTSEAHVGDGTFVLRAAGFGHFSCGSSCFRLGLVSSPDDTTNHVRHASASVGTKHLHSDDVGALSNTILAGRNGTCAVGSMTVTVVVDIVVRNSRAPERAALELDVVDVDAGVNDVYINTLTTSWVVDVLGERRESKFGTVTDTSQSLLPRQRLCKAHVWYDLPMVPTSVCPECAQSGPSRHMRPLACGESAPQPAP